MSDALNHRPTSMLSGWGRSSRRGLLTGATRVAGGGAVALAMGGVGLSRARGVLAQDATPGAEGTPETEMAGIDPQMQKIITALASFDNPPIPELNPFQARQLPSFANAYQAVLSEEGKPAIEPVANVSHTVIPGPVDGIVARVYTPTGDGPFPVLVYFHGGGFVIANLDTYDASCRALANAASCVVISVAYRQAPENPFPAAVDDAYAATQYVIANTAEFGGKAGVVAVGGESAGGNLATVVCLRARDEGAPLPVHQLLVYPLVTLAPEGEALESVVQYGQAKPLNADLLDWFGSYYAADPSALTNPYGSPLAAADLSSTPPATVIAAQIDPLQSQGRLYADALEAAGVDVTYTLYEGVTHEFFGLTMVVDKAKEAVQEAADRLTESFDAAS